MFDYDTLRVIWWILLGALLIGFAVMDGFDFGVAALLRLLGRNDDERRVVLETVEPVWEGNQVWFILAGGATFAAWPMVYAVAFSGFYVAMFLLLAAFILRPVSFGYRNKSANPQWRNTWDWISTVTGIAAPLIFGVAFGNLFLGAPFRFDADMRMIYTGGFFDLLHPFALLCGLISVVMLAMHGAAYAAMKVDLKFAARASRYARLTALGFVVLYSIAGIWLLLGIPGYTIVSAIHDNGVSNPLLKQVAVQGNWFAGFAAHPTFWLAPALALASATGVVVLASAARHGLVFVCSGVAVAACIASAGFALFPFLMPSSIDPHSSLTIWDASSSKSTLGMMMLAVVVLLPIVMAYTAWVFHVLRGRVNLDDVRHSHGMY